MIDEKKLIEDIKKCDMYDWHTEEVLSMVEEQPKIGGWIPCSERLPETSEYMEFEPTPYMKRLEIAYMTDMVEYLIG